MYYYRMTSLMTELQKPKYGDLIKSLFDRLQPKHKIVILKDKVKRIIKNKAKENMDKVIAELKTDYNNIENADKCLKRYKRTKGNKYYLIQHRDVDYNTSKQRTIKYYTCIFGMFDLDKDENVSIKNNDVSLLWGSYKIPDWRIKNGIEVLGMKPDRDKAGKYTYSGKTIQELKQI